MPIRRVPSGSAHLVLLSVCVIVALIGVTWTIQDLVRHEHTHWAMVVALVLWCVVAVLCGWRLVVEWRRGPAASEISDGAAPKP